MDKYRELLDCVSDCCNAPTNSDVPICTHCGEHCDIYFEEN